jgi:hypothetical protein
MVADTIGNPAGFGWNQSVAAKYPAHRKAKERLPLISKLAVEPFADLSPPCHLLLGMSSAHWVGMQRKGIDALGQHEHCRFNLLSAFVATVYRKALRIRLKFGQIPNPAPSWQEVLASDLFFENCELFFAKHTLIEVPRLIRKI